MSVIIEKKALRGVEGVRLWEILENTQTAYTVGEQFKVNSSQTITKETNKSEFTISADNATYATGTDYNYEDLTVQVAELTPRLEAKLQGSNYDEETGVYSYASEDVAPEYALGYAASNISGGFRMFVHLSVKLMNVKVDHNTKGNGNTDIQPYTLTFRNTQRNLVVNGKRDVRLTKDSADKTYAWLDTALDEYKVKDNTGV